MSQIPAPRVDFLDPITGKISREWYRWLFERIGGTTIAGQVPDVTETTPLGAPLVSASGATYEWGVVDLSNSTSVVNSPSPGHPFLLMGS